MSPFPCEIKFTTFWINSVILLYILYTLTRVVDYYKEVILIFSTQQLHFVFQWLWGFIL